MGDQSKILKLQKLYFETQDVVKYNPANKKQLYNIVIKYEKLLKLLNEKKPNIFGNILSIGINEILDHFDLLNNENSKDKQETYFNDFAIYLQESIIDCRSLLRDSSLSEEINL